MGLRAPLHVGMEEHVDTPDNVEETPITAASLNVHALLDYLVHAVKIVRC